MKDYFYRIGINTSVQFVSKLCTAVLGFLGVGLLTRYLGQIGFGNFTLIFVYLSFFGIIADSGLQLTMSRDIAKGKHLPEKIYGTFFWLKIILIFISIVLAFISLAFLPYPPLVKRGIFVASVGVGLGFFNSFGTTILQANLRLDLVALIDLLAKAVTVAFVFIFVLMQKNFYYILNTILIGNFAALILTIFLLNKIKKIKLSFDLNLAKKISVKALPVAAISALALLYFKIDTLILSIIRGIKEVGIYGLAYKVVENLLLVWGFYMATIYPLLAKLANNKKIKETVGLWKISLTISIILSLLVSILAFVFAPLLIKILGGQDFASSVMPLRILLCSLPLFFVNNLFYHSFLLEEKTKLILKAIGTSLIFNIIINLIFIPKYGYIAASVSTVITEVYLSIIYFINRYKIKSLTG